VKMSESDPMKDLKPRESGGSAVSHKKRPELKEIA
jgi:hypothetical protein